MDRRTLRARYCFNCGTALVAGRLSCLRCGTQLEAFEEPEVVSDRLPPSDALPVGTWLGERYEIASFLDSSRMHLSYRATDTVFQRVVTLRTLRNKEQGNATRRAEFRRQASLQNALEHRNIVSTLDFFEDRQLNIEVSVQQQTTGMNLKRWLKQVQRPLPLPRLIFRHIMEPITSAVAYAHRHGVIHRNLKPSKIVFDRFERPLLADFGLSAYSIPQARAGNMPAIVGTLEYMAPEQADDPLTLDARSDIYALGVIFYELVSGTLPIRGSNDLDLLNNLLQSQPTPLIEHAPNVPPGLDAVVMQCLAKRPGHRFPSADMLLLRLIDALEPTDSLGL